MKVYVITAGEYSGYHIVGVTHDEERAKSWVSAYNAGQGSYNLAQVEEYETDDFGRDGVYLYQIRKEDDEVTVTLEDPSMPWAHDGIPHIWDNDFELNVWAKNPDEAFKASCDIMSQEKARRAGLI